jgi:hypothetical protein
MKKLRYAVAAAVLGSVAIAQSASALENAPGVAMTKPGATLGGAAADPPPGIYMINQMFTYQATFSGGGVAASGLNNTHKSVWVEVNGFLFVPGWSFLGATYTFAIFQPWVNANLSPPINVVVIGANDTFISPVSLSWKLGDSGFFVAANLGMYVPDGNINGPTGLNNIGQPWWTFQPQLVISYLKDGWNITANNYAEFMTNNYIDGYQNKGVIYHTDAQILKTVGKWTFGPVGYVATQLGSDNVPVGSTAAALGQTAVGPWTLAAVGGFVGYDFGPVNLQVWGTQEVYSRVTQNTAAGGGAVAGSDTIDRGFTIWANLIFKVWGPEPPPPAKSPLIVK